MADHVARYNFTQAFHLLSQCNIFVGNQRKVKLHVVLIVNVSYREWTKDYKIGGVRPIIRQSNSPTVRQSDSPTVR